LKRQPGSRGGAPACCATTPSMKFLALGQPRHPTSLPDHPRGQCWTRLRALEPADHSPWLRSAVSDLQPDPLTCRNGHGCRRAGGGEGLPAPAEVRGPCRPSAQQGGRPRRPPPPLPAAAASAACRHPCILPPRPPARARPQVGPRQAGLGRARLPAGRRVQTGGHRGGGRGRGHGCACFPPLPGPSPARCIAALEI
jgi:hypothetical protein